MASAASSSSVSAPASSSRPRPPPTGTTASAADHRLPDNARVHFVPPLPVMSEDQANEQLKYIELNASLGEKSILL